MAARHRSTLKHLLLPVSFRGRYWSAHRLWVSLHECDPPQHQEKHATLSLLPYVMFSQTPSGWIAVEPALCKHETIDNRGETPRGINGVK